jgi:hypothetical protein
MLQGMWRGFVVGQVGGLGVLLEHLVDADSGQRRTLRVGEQIGTSEQANTSHECSIRERLSVKLRVRRGSMAPCVSSFPLSRTTTFQTVHASRASLIKRCHRAALCADLLKILADDFVHDRIIPSRLGYFNSTSVPNLRGQTL